MIKNLFHFVSIIIHCAKHDKISIYKLSGDKITDDDRKEEYIDKILVNGQIIVDQTVIFDQHIQLVLD